LIGIIDGVDYEYWGRVRSVDNNCEGIVSEATRKIAGKGLCVWII